MTRRPRLRPGEGITGSAASERAPVMLESQAHLDPRFKHFPNLPEDEYESILAVPILTRDGTLEGALNVRTRRPRLFARGRGRAAARDRRPGGAVDRAREAVRRGAASRARARGARPDLGSGLELALPRGVARGDRQDDDGRALGHGRRTRARRRPDRVARGSGERARAPPAAALARPADRRAGRRPRDAVHRGRRRAACVDRDPCRRCARARSRRDARRARPGDSSPRQEQPADGRIAPSPAGPVGRRRSTRARRSSIRSTASSRSPPCTSC